jgi:ATP-dependent RNA helicase RhlE
MHFQDLNLIDPLLRAVRAEGYETPTPIQEQAIPHVLSGRDLIGCAQTGTGKTAAFALPILQHLSERQPNGAIRALILSPTRELATQIGDSFAVYGRNLRLRTIVIYGGVGQQPQVDKLRRGADILVATPGRLLDLMNQGYVNLNRIEIFVLDEADRMLDMGFIHDVRRVISALPTRRQTLLFSATMPQDIQDLADRILVKPVRVEVTPQATTVEKIDQSVFFVEKKDKRALLEHLLSDRAIRRVLVFTRTKHGANKLVEQLFRSNIQAEAIHGNKSQSARERALANFKSGRTRVLVATDIAARGIDVDDVTHVINYDLPNEPESYVHRIGRTARAGASGIAYSFCDAEERTHLRDIEKLIRLRVPVVAEHPYAAAHTALPVHADSRPNPRRFNRNENERRGGQPSSRQGGSPRRDQQHSGRTNANRPPQHAEGRRSQPK